MHSYGGIKKIKIPFKKEDFLSFTESELVGVYDKYLPYCLELHYSNAIKEDKLYNYFLGYQDIFNKKRPYLGADNTDNENNQQVVENHANAQVSFKVDFLMGDKMQFTHKADTQSDDLTIFERFLSDSGFYTNFREAKKYMYAMGVGVTYAVPRTDIIDFNGKYKTSYDKDREAPFVFKDVDPRYNFVVYSNYFDEQPLFSVSIVVDNVSNESVIYVNNGKYNFIYKNKYPQSYDTTTPDEIIINAFERIPIIEHARNGERMGVIELNKDLFDLINLIISNSGDAVVDTVNNILVFENVEVDAETVQEMRKGGTIKVKSSGDPSVQSKVYTLEVKLNHSDINVFYEQRVTKAYDIAGVPIASGVTSTGGETGKAKLLGAGWENAYQKGKGDIIGMEKSDYAVLELLLDICHLIPQSKVNELSASQIEIKYNINPNDNILSKAQSANNLYQIGMPAEMILGMTNLSMDARADGIKWDANIQKRAEEQLKMQEKIAQNNANKMTGKDDGGKNQTNTNREISTPKGKE